MTLWGRLRAAVDLPAAATVVQKGLERLGLDVQRARASEGAYARVLPRATYSPWNTDAEFRAVYARVAGHTLVDVYRCHELWSLTREVAVVPGAIVEVGVWRGGTGAILASAARRAGIMDPVYLCDTFTGVPKAGAGDGVYRGGEHANTSRARVEGLLSAMGLLERATIVPGVFPDESAGAVRSERFRLAHIDVDVYASAKDCFEYLWPRISVGGVVVFDDYGFDGPNGVRRYVDELRGHEDRVVVHNLNGHAVVVKTLG